jgi:HlyD family secretion protein
MAGVTSVGGYYGYQRFYPKPVVAAAVNAVEVARGNLQASVTATGTVAAPAQSRLTFKASGRLIDLPVTVGDAVKAGQVLARLDDTDLRVALLQARNAVVSAEVRLAQAKEGARPEDLRVARASVEAARSKLEQLQSYAGGPDVAILKSQRETARIKVEQAANPTRSEDIDAARAQVVAARAKLAQLKNPRAEDIAAAESQLQAQANKLEQIRNPRAEDMRNAEASVASAQSKLQALMNPRAEDLRNAESAASAAQAKLQALVNPRAEDLANSQLTLDQQRTKLAQLLDAPRAKPEDIANAQLAVQNAQIALDKARYDQARASDRSSTVTQAAADAQVLQASIALQTQQNNLSKLQGQGPTDWEIRLQQQAVTQAQAAFDKIKSPSTADLQAAQSSVDQAKATLEKLRAPSQYDIENAQILVEQARATLDKLRVPSQYDVTTAEEAVTQARISVEKLRNPTEADVSGAEQSVVQAETTLTKLLNPTPYDQRTAEESFAQANLSLERAMTSNGYDVRNAETSLAQAQAQLDLKLAGPTALEIRAAEVALEQAQISLTQAEANLGNATIVAPFDGVVAAVAGNIGEQVGGGTTVVTLVDAKQLRVDVVVDETDVGKIALGLPVTVTFEALAGQRFPATVKVVAPTATVQSGVVSYAIQVQLSQGASMVRPGMTATAAITIASREDVVVVPNRAIKTVQRNKTVDVQTADGKIETRPVRVGLANDSQSEIVEGLVAGERVILPTTAVRSVSSGGGGGPMGGGPPRID